MADREILLSDKMIAHSDLVPGLHGRIIRFIDEDHFIILVDGKEILCNKNYWRVENA
jgi:hypothetical protein